MRSGRIRNVLYGPDGAVQGFTLRDNTAVSLAPDLGAQLRTTLRRGQSVRVSGVQQQAGSQRTLAAQSITVNGRTLQASANAPGDPGIGPATGDMAPPPPPGGPGGPRGPRRGRPGAPPPPPPPGPAAVPPPPPSPEGGGPPPDPAQPATAAPNPSGSPNQPPPDGGVAPATPPQP